MCQIARRDDIIRWKYFPRYWPFVWGIHRWPVNSPHKGQWRWALMFSLIGACVNNRDAGDLRRHRANYDVTVMISPSPSEETLRTWVHKSHKSLRMMDVNTIKPCIFYAMFASSQWETALLCNDVSNWLDVSLESALLHVCPTKPGHCSVHAASHGMHESRQVGHFFRKLKRCDFMDWVPSFRNTTCHESLVSSGICRNTKWWLGSK